MGLILVLILLCVIIMLLSYLSYKVYSQAEQEQADFSLQGELLKQGLLKINKEIIQINEHLDKEEKSRGQ